MKWWALAEHVGFTLTVLWAAGTWLLRKHDRAVTRDAFVEEMRTNHLPHIYNALARIADKLNIDLEEQNIGRD